MIKSIGKLSLVTILTALVLGLPLVVSAQDKTMPAPSSPAATTTKTIPFTGKLGSVDKVNMTITLDEKKTNRVFGVTSETKITKSGKPATPATPATLGDGIVGEPVTGSYVKAADGKLTARSIIFGPKPKTP